MKLLLPILVMALTLTLPVQAQDVASMLDGLSAQFSGGGIEDYIFHVLERLLNVLAQFVGQLFMYGVQALQALLPSWFGGTAGTSSELFHL